MELVRRDVLFLYVELEDGAPPLSAYNMLVGIGTSHCILHAETFCVVEGKGGGSQTDLSGQTDR